MVKNLVDEERAPARMNATFSVLDGRKLNETGNGSPRRHSMPMRVPLLRDGIQRQDVPVNGADVLDASRDDHGWDVEALLRQHGSAEGTNGVARPSSACSDRSSPHLKQSLERAISALSEQNAVINELKETNQRLMVSLEEKTLECLRLEALLRDNAAAMMHHGQIHAAASAFAALQQTPTEPASELAGDHRMVLMHSNVGTPVELSPRNSVRGMVSRPVTPVQAPTEEEAHNGVDHARKESFSEIQLMGDDPPPMIPITPQARQQYDLLHLASVEMQIPGGMEPGEDDEREEAEDEQFISKTTATRQSRPWAELASKEGSDRAHELDKHGLLYMLLRPQHSCQVHFVRNRVHLGKYIQVKSIWAAVCGIFGLVMVVVQNEMVMRGASPSGAGLTVLKLLNTLATLLCLALIFHVHWYFVLSERLDMHTKLGYPFNDKDLLREILRRRTYWLETVLCALHLPPGCSFEFGSSNMGNFVLYRAEALEFLVCSVRLYLAFRVFWHWMVTDLPKKHIVPLFSDARVGPFFALKRCFEGWQAIKFITFIWLGVIIICGYLFRLSEMSACFLKSGQDNPDCQRENAVQWSLDAGDSYFDVSNDLYIWNSLWVMFITSITVGYGDLYPVTHLGRFVAVVAAMLGIVLASVLTASLESILAFSSPEHSARKHMEGAKIRERLREKAASYIACWVRVRRSQRALSSGGGAGSTRVDRSSMDPLTLSRQAFWNCKTASEKLAREDDCSSVEDKVAKSLRRVIYMEAVMERLTRRLKVSDLAHHAEHRNHVHKMTKTRSSSEDHGSQQEGMQLMVGDARRASLTRVMGLLGSMSKKTIMTSESFVRRGETDWRQNKRMVERKAVRTATLHAACALAGLLCSLIVNELIFADVNPRAPSIEVLKTINMLLSLGSLPLIYLCYSYRILLARLVRARAIAKLASERLEVSPKEVLTHPTLWLEVLVCGLFLPPGATFESGTMQLSNFVMYRGETVFFMLNLLRCYVLVRLVKDYVLSRVAHLHSIASVNRVHIGYRFVAKHLHNSSAAGLYIAVVWLLCMVLLACLTRASEFPACDLTHSAHPRCETDQVWLLYGSEVGRDNFIYYQNAWWCMFVTGTTVGYGDLYPATHLGRLFASMSAVAGVFATSLLTAALIKLLTRSSDEECALNFLRRERAIERIPQLAASIIARAYRFKRRQKRLHEQAANGTGGVVSRLKAKFVGWEENHRQHKLFEELRSCKALVMQGPEEMASTEVQVDLLLKRVNRMSDSLELCLKAVRLLLQQQRATGAALSSMRRRSAAEAGQPQGGGAGGTSGEGSGGAPGARGSLGGRLAPPPFVMPEGEAGATESGGGSGESAERGAAAGRAAGALQGAGAAGA